MRREVTLEEISDGRLYEANDMVKADCQDCKGCFDCCTGMGDSVVLDPLAVKSGTSLKCGPAACRKNRAWRHRRKYSAAS